MADNLDIMSAIWETASPTFQERIPQPSRDNFAAIGVMIASDDYEAERNEIHDVLINQIGKQKVWQRSITNRLAQFKSGEMSYGDTYQEILSDVIDGQTFRIGTDDQFAKWANKVAASYHKINREQFYPVTIEDTKLIRAFQREGGLQALVNSLTNQMYSSNDLDEFIYTKKLMSSYYNATGDLAVRSTQKVATFDPREDITDVEKASVFTMTCMGVMREMTFPKRAYNPPGFMLQSQPSELMCIMPASVAIVHNVTQIAGAFNPEQLGLNVPIVTVDNFGEGMDKVTAIICDKQWLRIMDNLRKLKMAENARNLYRNYFYHVHQLYAASPFCNVCFIESNTP